MATLYPIIIGNFKFLVNPTKMKVQKRSQIQELRTMGGTVFQVWPDLPDEVSMEGMAYGYRSVTELRGLQQQIQRDPSKKLTKLVYKHKTYNVYIRDLSVSIDADHPYQFNYQLSCVSKEPFNMDTMPIGQLPGIKAEFDFFASQLQQASAVIANMPNDVYNNAVSVYGQIFGKTGSAQHGLGIFIGRPRNRVYNP
jgi:hypothetical protein